MYCRINSSGVWNVIHLPKQQWHNLRLIVKRYAIIFILFLLVMPMHAQMISDKDNDGIVDFADMDSDNDGISDIDEGVICEVVDLDALFPNGSTNALEDFNNAQIVVGGVNGALIQVDTSFSGGATLDEFEISNRHTGNQSGLLLGVNSTDPSQTLSETYSFSELVCDFSITVFDLDRTDAIIVEGFNAGTIVPFTLTSVGQCIGFDAVPNELISTCNVQVEPGNGDVLAHSFTLQFDGCIDTMRLTYFDQGPGNGGSFTFVPTPFPTCLGPDTDGDGIPDALDLDSDNDGIPDAVEACGQFNLNLEECSLDDNNDGVYQMQNGESTGILVDICADAPIDTDDDGIPDFLDLDSDGDGCPDAIEACTTSNPNVNDSAVSDGYEVPAAAVDDCGLVFDTDGMTTFCEDPPSTNYINDAIGCLEADLTFIQDITCFGDDDGSASVLATDGNLPYSYLWSPSGETTALATMLQPGTNTVTVTDGCDETDILTIDIQEPTLLVLESTQVNILCNGESTGSIDLTASGGTPGYTYLWNDGITTQDRMNLPAGTYTVTATDTNDCTEMTTVTITEPPLLVATTSSVDILCNGDATGSIDLSVVGGVMPYTFLWNDGITTKDRMNLPAGTYTLTATDANGCTEMTTVTITEPPLLVATTSSVDILCNGDATGRIDLSVVGGVMPYTFLWNDGITTEDRMNLLAGTYTATVTDQNNCTTSVTVTLTEPTVLVVSLAPTNILCNGDATGSIDATVSGGTLPYTFSYNTGQATEDLMNIQAGTYILTVTDANNCIEIQQVTLTEPPLLVLTSTTQDVTCNSEATGAINLTVTGGTLPYTFLWNDGVSTEDRNDILAGNYVVTITDDNGCTLEESFVIAEPPALVVSGTSQNALCAGENNGSINLSISGGTPSYTFIWNDGVTTQNRLNLAAGNYTVFVIDMNGCSKVREFVINELIPLALEVQIGCEMTVTPGCDAVLSYAVTGGSGNFTVVITDQFGNDVPPNQPGPNWTNLCDGQYDIRVMDTDAGCEATESFIVCPLTCDLVLNVEDIVNITCFGDADGSATVSASSSALPISLVWEFNDVPFGTGPSQTNLEAGVYKVIATDAINCEEQLTLVIDEPAELIITNCTSVNVSTPEGSDGSLTLSVSGGTAPLSFEWSNGESTNPIENLTPATYTVTVTDANGCENTSACTVQPLVCDDFSTNATITDVACHGESTGEIELTVFGGLGIITYQWTPVVSTTNIASNLPAGSYQIVVTDEALCTETIIADISEPSLLSGAIDAGNVSCFGFGDGTVDLQVTGGVEPYQFVWSNGITTEDQLNLAPGQYDVIVTDANDCTINLGISLIQPDELICTSTNDSNAICSLANGVGTVSVVGGFAPYVYAWDNGETTPTATSLTSGLHTVTITDSNRCELVCDVTIEETCDPCLELIKSSSLDVGADNVATPSDLVTYTYEIINCGDVTVTDISIQENPGSFSGTGALPIPVVPANTDLDPSESIIIEAQYEITLIDINTGFIDNQALINGLDPDGNDVDDLSDTGNDNDVNETGGPDDPTNTPIGATPCIEILKSSTVNLGIDNQVSAGDLISYFYTISNCGNVTLDNVLISEDPVLFSGTGLIPVPEALLVTTLNPGESTTSSASYSITQADIDAGFVDNQAITETQDPSGNPVMDLSDTQNPNDVNETGGPDDPTNTPLDQDPCLNLTKGSLLNLGANGVADPGDIVTYTYELTNCGNVTLSNVTLTEDATLFTGTGTLPVPSTPPSVLAPNESATLTSTYMITQMDIDAGSIDNQAIANAIDPDGNPVDDLSDTSNPQDVNETGGPDDPTNTPIGESPCIEVIKVSSLDTGADGIATPDDIITYSYTIINCGNTTLSGITLTESATLFTGTGLIPMPSTPSSTTLSPAEEATASATYAITQEDIDAGLVDNQALVSGTSPAGDTTMDESDTGNDNDINETGGPDDPTNTPIPQGPCIEIVKSSSLDLGVDAASTVGDVITYEYVISNCGNVTLEDVDLIEDATLFSGTGMLPAINPLTVTTLAPGDQTTTTSTYSISQVDIDAAFVDNQAIASGNPPFGGTISDLSDTGNTGDVNETGGPDDPTNTPIPQEACIELLKSSTFDPGMDGIATIGDIITYDYVIINCGTTTLNTISLSEDPALFTGTGNLPVPSALTVTILEPGQSTTASASYEITQADIDAGSVDNQAIVQAQDPSGDPVMDLSDTQNPNDVNETGGPDDPTNTSFPTGACIVVTKGSILDLGANGIADPRDIVTYTYELSNCGNVTLSNVTLTEDATLFTGTGTLPVPSTPPSVLAPNESATLSSTYIITQMDINAGFIDNQAITNSVDPDGNAVNDLSDTSNTDDVNETGGPDDPTNTPIGGNDCLEAFKGSSLDLGDDNQASVGDILTFNYEIINCGNTTISGITLIEIDELFSGTGLLPIPTTPNPQILAPGETATSSATYTLTQADIDAGEIVNQALGNGTGPSGDTVADESDTSNPNDPNETGGPNDATFTDVPQVPCIELIKSSSFDLGPDNLTNAGDVINYTYTFSNCGNVTLSNLSLEETLASFSGSGGLPMIEDLLVTTLAPGQESTTTGTYQVTQQDIDTGFVDNQALISGTTPSGDTTEDLSDTGNPNDINETGGPDDPTNTPLEELPCIEVVKGSSLDVGADGIVSPNDVISYNYVVTNCGNVTLSNISLIEDSGLFTGAGTLPIPSVSMPAIILPGESATATATYLITQQDIDLGFVDNQAIVIADDPLGNPITDLSDTSNDDDVNETGGGDDPTNTPLEEVPCIAILKSSVLDLGADNIANPGDQITYTYEVTNCGNITLDNVAIAEDDLFSGSGQPPIVPAIVPSILAPGDTNITSATYTLTQADVNAGFITNQAIATGQEPNGDTVEDLSDTANEADPTETGGPDDPTFTDVPQESCISLEKSSVLLIDDSGLSAVGDIIAYTFEVTNCGNVTLTNLSLDETTFTGTGDNFIIESIPVSLLNPGETFSVNATYEITQADIDAGSVDNQALISSTNPLETSVTDLSDTANPNDVNETGGPDDPTNTPLPNTDCLELIKSSVFILGENQISNPGDMIIYTYEYSNCGNTTLLNVDITEDDTFFTGTGDLPIINLTVTTLLPGQTESVEATYVVTQADVDAGMINNQALAVGNTPQGNPVEDLSDTGNPNDPNETGGPDDPTSTEIGIVPCIELLKSSSFTSTNGAEGFITYLYTIRNCGNVTLSNIELTEREDLFTGTNGIPIIILSSITTLLVGESTTATAEYQVSIDDVIVHSVDNQAIVTATDPQGEVVEDLSDTANPNDANETGGPDDPTNTEIDIVSTVEGTVFEDLDGNTIEDIPIEGIIVTITDQGGIVQVDTTDANGNYMFADVIPGVITIVETDPEGFNSVSDTDGDNDNIITVFIQPSDMSMDNDFIDEEPGIVSGNVSDDEGADLTADVPLVNVMITLIDRDSMAFITFTDSLGNYVFENINPGPVTIIETDPEDFSSVADVDGGDPNVIITFLMSGEDKPDQDFLDAQCDELVCNNALQISLNVDCELVLDADDVLEAPIPGDYTIALFDEYGEFIRNNILTADEAGETIMYQISCLDNSCWGSIIVEANIIPQITSPCACTDDGTIPEECNLWCTPENTFPAGIISPDEAASRFGFCGPDLLGGIKVTEIRTGDICADGGEIIELMYTGKVILHGQLSEVDILCQRYSVLPISLDTTSFSFPNDINLDCNYLDDTDLTDADFGSPRSILEATDNIINAYPYYINTHDSIPLVEIRFDTAQIIVGQTLRDTMVKELIDGVEEWVLKTVVHKIFEDEISEVRDTIGMTPELIPIEDRVCNILSSFSDTPFEACGSGTKIIRTWELIDWCNSEVSLSGRQTIEIQDLTPPAIVEYVDGELVERTTFDDVIVSIEAYRCEASVRIPQLLTRDNCDPNPNVVWQTDEGTIGENFITGLWLSDEPIMVTAIITDDCGNESTATFNYFVIDDVPPVVSCETSLQVSLTSSASTGFAFADVSAFDLDEGSHDSGCGKVTLTAIRAEDWRTPVYNCNSNVVGFESVSCSGNTVDVDLGTSEGKDGCNFDISTIGTISSPGESVRFCCEDIGKIIPVILFVEDENGNINQCLVNVEITDNSSPRFDCQDLVVDCSEGVDLTNPPLAGTLCDTERSYTAELFREIRDNVACFGGTVIREWYIDLNNNSAYENTEPFCRQVVTVSSEDSFDPNSIKWPKHFDGSTIDGINIEYIDGETVEVPASISMGEALKCTPSNDDEDQNEFIPVWCGTDCGLVGISSETDTITAGDACLKLIKRWTIVDWCTYNSNQQNIDDENDTSSDTFEAVEDWAQFEHESCKSYSSMIDDPVYFRYSEVDLDGYYTFDQVISVVDDQAPEIMVEESILVNTSGGATTKDDTSPCTGEINVTATAVDFCNSALTASTELRWQITVFNRNEIILRETASGPKVTLSSLIGEASDEFVVQWQVTDGCGNEASSQTVVEFIDQQAPTPFCIPGISTVFMRSDGTITLWSNEFDFGSFDNCTVAEDLRFSIVERGQRPILPGDEGFEDQSSISLHCSEINGLGNFDMWVWDADGNGDFCSVDAVISDPGNQCEEEVGSNGIISGKISTSYGMEIADVDVTLSSNEQSEFPKQSITDSQGQYAFNNNPSGFNYVINADKPDEYINGLSTLDVFQITRHILGTTIITDPYKIIAADANGDSQLTASDINIFRRVILGLDDKLENQSAWIFVPSGFTFIDQTNPWPFVQSIRIDDFAESSSANDFMAIKVGDINESYDQAETRSSNEVTLEITNEQAKKDELVYVPIRSQRELIGFQFTLNIKGLSYVDVIPGSISLTNENIGVHQHDLSFSWNVLDSESIKSEDELFTLIFKATDNTSLSKAITLSSSITRAEAYGTDIHEVHPISLSILSNDHNVLVHQNSPNPFSEFTKIDFELKNSTQISLSIFNLAGQGIFETSGYFNSGANSITISEEDLSHAKGVLYYRLQVDGESYIRRMISLD